MIMARSEAALRRGKGQFDELRGVEPLFDQGDQIKVTFYFPDVVDVSSGAGMRRDKETTAVLVWLNRYVKGADALRLFGNFNLIHSNQRTKDRQPRGFFHDAEIFRGLRGDLPETITGDEGPAALAPGQLFGNSDHHAPIEDNSKRRRRAHHNLSLDIAERNQIQPGLELIAGQQGSELTHFFFRGARDIGTAVEMDEDRGAPALHETKRRDWRIDSA